MTPRDDIPILYRDDELVVVDKPAGALVVAAPGRRDRTLVERVGRLLGQRVFAVHRLDEDTTGVLVLATTSASKRAIEALFRAHRIERVYRALVSRVPAPPAGRIESRLRVGEDGIVGSVERGGERAVTEYRTIERRGRYALVECRLETGRRNQIRAHLAELDCPVVGDRKYGFRPRPGEKVGRPLLHAYRLAFEHPTTGRLIEIICEPREAELR